MSRRLAAILSVAALLLSVAPATAVEPLSGAIFTTEVICDGTNINIYSDKEDVYLDGGPVHEGAAGLPDGDYYVKVTEPDGTLLGTSVGSGDDTPVLVVGGEFDTCYQLSAILIKASDSTPGYDTTTNGGGVYKVWVCTDSEFTASQCKTDNFKVNEGDEETETFEGCLSGEKFYDSNNDGDKGLPADEPPIAGWEIFIQLPDGSVTSEVTDADGRWEHCVESEDFADIDGTYHIAEGIPNPADDWVQTYPDEQQDWVDNGAASDGSIGVSVSTTTRSYSVTVPSGLEDSWFVTGLDFGNNCQVTPGGRTIGFWSNKNGQSLITAGDMTALNAFYLANGAGTDTNFTASLLSQKKAAYKSWLLSATATNMAYMLSAQMSATYLNLQHGFTSNVNVTTSCGSFDGGDGFCTVSELIQYAQYLITNDPLCLSTCTERGEQQRVKNLFDLINNGGTIVFPPGTCLTPEAYNSPFAFT